MTDRKLALLIIACVFGAVVALMLVNAVLAGIEAVL
jgi:hypothetical protein